MSDHAWTREHAAAYVVGGLSAEEAERLEAHTRDCPECAADVADARRLDGDLRDLFVDERPTPGLEDRAIRSTRTVRRRRRLRMSSRMARFVVAAGVLVALGSVGAFLGDRLPLPGEGASIFVVKGSDASGSMRAENKLKNSHVAFGTVDFGERAESFAANAPTANDYAEGVNGRDQTGTPNAWYGFSPDGKNLLTGITGLNSDKDGKVNWGKDGKVNWGDTTVHMLQIQNGAGDPAVRTYGGTVSSDRGRGDGQQGITNGTTYFRNFSDQTYKAPAGDVKGHGQGETPQFKLSEQGGEARKGIQNYTFGLHFNPAEHRPGVPGDPKEPALAGQILSTPALQTKESTQPGADAPAPAPAGRVIIRSGDMDFEVDSFDAAAAIVTRLVGGTKGAFIATVNSDKLANGKVKGTITVRTPPEALDKLVADLRRELHGDLKGMKIGSQDITKQYTDLESRLRAARTMEQRLLQIIKDGKGEIKDLVAAERELGVWRTKIEEIEGELRYYANLVSLSTLTISLTEKEIRAAAAVTESEKVQAGIEVEDVDKAYQQALAAVAEAKGRVAKSELKQLAAGQFNATLQFDVPPDASGPMRDRLRQLGRVARLEIDRSQNPVGGTTPADAKVKRGDTTFVVQIYNLANIEPRETVTLGVAAIDVRAAFQALRDAAAKSGGRVKVAQLAEQDAQNVSAQFAVEIRRADEGPIQAALAAAGEVLGRQVTRAPETDQYTDSKLLYNVTLLSVNNLRPRETATLTLEVADVSQSAAVLATQIADAGGRQVSSDSSTEQNGKATAKLTYEVPLSAAGLADKFKSLGAVRGFQTTRNPQAPSGKLATARIDVTLVSGDEGIWPRVRRGLSHSATVLLTSLTWVVVGLCVVLPFGVVGYGGYRIVRRLVRPATTTTT
jgi:hypothetical protein